MVKVKICATRSLEAARVAVDNGADFLGFVFTPNTKTHSVDVKVAEEICKRLKREINLVGVFQNMPLEYVKKIIHDCNLDYAQFHGDENQDYVDQIDIKTIKAFRFVGDFNVESARKQMKEFRVDFYLLDRIKQSEGPMLSLEKVAILAQEFPLFFAGGLTPENVASVVKIVSPFIADVASGVETNGEQDMEKIKKFILEAKGMKNYE